MRPFVGYDMGDYWQHWLDMGKMIANPPKIFHVNWFRTDENGHFIWPGFGDNMRVLMWILARCAGTVGAVDTPIGYVPRPEDIDITGLNLTLDDLKGLLTVDRELWLEAPASSIIRWVIVFPPSCTTNLPISRRDSPNKLRYQRPSTA